MKRLCLSIACMTVLCALNSGAQEADAILGEWLTGDDRALVEIYRCGARY
jgi:hypothetical protein